jgi:hypothetical protein
MKQIFAATNERGEGRWELGGINAAGVNYSCDPKSHTVGIKMSTYMNFLSFPKRVGKSAIFQIRTRERVEGQK